MSIDNYFKAVDEIHKSINEIASQKYAENHKITLIFSLIDLLSKSVYGNGFKHGEKFQKTLSDFFQWDYLNYVSLQMLALEFEGNNDKRFNVLKEFVLSKVNEFPDCVPLPLSFDVDIKLIEPMWPQNIRLNNKILEQFSHRRLIYLYRNSLVHEMRPKGAQFNLFDMDEPHYVPFSTLGLDKNGESKLIKDVWKLKYPYAFFEMMYLDIRNAIERYLRSENIDPYINFKFTDNWLES